jgi:uncharacterized oligopeptide transporter (OPT) family protein
MYRLELLSFLPKDDFGRLVALTAASGFFGIFFVIPLRKYFIIRQKMVFPTPTATAFTIRSLHNVRTGAQTATKKSLALLYSLVATFVYKVVAGFAPGLVSGALSELDSVVKLGIAIRLAHWLDAL